MSDNEQKAQDLQRTQKMDRLRDRTDELASSPFAVISLLTFVITAYIGSSFGATNAGLGIGVIIMSTLLFVCPLLLYLPDAQLVARLLKLGIACATHPSK